MNGRVIPGAATEPQVEGLSSADVRQAVDEAIRRGWLEMARRTLRVIVLMLELADVRVRMATEEMMMGVPLARELSI